MADLATIIEQLQTALEDNDRQRLTLIADSERIQAAITALGADVPPQAAPTEVRPAPAETRPKQPETRPKPPPAAKKSQTYVPCPKCGFQCTPQNMWRHDRKAHGEAAPAAVADLAARAEEFAAEGRKPAPAAPAKPTRGRVLACTECDFTVRVADAKKMSHHTITTHRRGPLRAERTPVEVAA